MQRQTNWQQRQRRQQQQQQLLLLLQRSTVLLLLLLHRITVLLLLLLLLLGFRSISSEWLTSVFGVHSLDLLHPEAAAAAAAAGSSNDSLGLRVAAVIKELQAQRRQPDFMNLTVIRQGDTNEQM